MYVAILQIEIAFAPNHERVRFLPWISGASEHSRSGNFFLSQKVDDILFHASVTILLKLFWFALYGVHEMLQWPPRDQKSAHVRMGLTVSLIMTLTMPI